MTDQVKEILHELEELSDPERIEWAQNGLPTAMTVLGVTVPKLRPIIKELNRRFKKAPPLEVIEFAKSLNSLSALEAQQIAFEIIEKHKGAQHSLTLEDLLQFGQGMDNWISVDGFACYLSGPAWREGQIADEVILSWAGSSDKWWRRAAVVSTVALNQKARGGSGDPERTLMICRLVAQDKDDMVVKGLSWALRELAKRDVLPVLEFIDANESVLTKRVIREVRRKIETGRKYQ